MSTTTVQYTPVEVHGGHYVKRDDLWEERAMDGQVLARGAKARTAGAVLRVAVRDGYPGIVLGTARNSSVPGMVARLARHYGLAMRLHVPAAKADPSPEVKEAVNQGAVLAEHRPGYANVIASRARADAEQYGWYHIPLGLEHPLGVELTAMQVDNLPLDAQRLVIPVGSGMMLAGVTWGFERTGYAGHMPVLGVCVGQDPQRRLAAHAHPLWRRFVDLVPATVPFGHLYADPQLGGTLALDPVYEAKCLPYLRPGDLLWVVANRAWE